MKQAKIPTRKHDGWGTLLISPQLRCERYPLGDSPVSRNQDGKARATRPQDKRRAQPAPRVRAIAKPLRTTRKVCGESE